MASGYQEYCRMENARSLEFQRKAINSFMRVVIGMEPESGLLETIAPSEHILSQAALELLCHKDNWRTSLATLTNELLNQGLIEKGLQGELYARTLLILAHGSFCKQFLPTPAATFTVQQFLEALYAKEHHPLLSKLPKVIMKARINFNHFTPIKENLTHDDIPDLLHDLLRRRGALQLAPNQPTYDLLILFYVGSSSETFSPKNSGALVVQVKNKSEATSSTSVFGEPFTISTGTQAGKTKMPGQKAVNLRNSPNPNYFALGKVSVPVLFLLFDLGITKSTVAPPVEVSHSNSTTAPQIWSIHSRGNDAAIFRCLGEMGCWGVGAAFFKAITPEVTPHDELCQRNRTFLKCSRSARYCSKQWDRTDKPEADSGRARQPTAASAARTLGRRSGKMASKALRKN